MRARIAAQTAEPHHFAGVPAWCLTGSTAAALLPQVVAAINERCEEYSVDDIYSAALRAEATRVVDEELVKLETKAREAAAGAATTDGAGATVISEESVKADAAAFAVNPALLYTRLTSLFEGARGEVSTRLRNGSHRFHSLRCASQL
jgi:hypothetical protein